MDVRIIVLIVFFMSLIPTQTQFYASVFSFREKVFSPELVKNLVSKELIKDKADNTIKHKNKEYVVDYTLDNKLVGFVKNKIQSYRPDHVSVVIIDNNTGAVKTAIDYSRDKNQFGNEITFSSSHPAASIFKIVTASELIKKTNISSQTSFDFTGKSTTLYKYQLKEAKKWVRSQSLQKAFASSNNVIFAKAALKHLEGDDLLRAAKSLGFQSNIFDDIEVGISQVFQPTDNFSLAELASGFNTQTSLSPLHGAVLASIISNNGKLRKPYFVESINDKDNNDAVWIHLDKIESVLDEDTSQNLQEMMFLTTQKGTAARTFRRFYKSSIGKKIVVGGKTGSITGGEPFGKHDWFVSYAKPKEGDDLGISICVMIVNKKKWYVRSSELSKQIIEYYYKEHKRV